MSGFKHSYVITEIDPTYQTQFVVGVFEAEGLAIKAREEATERLKEEASYRGVYFQITAFEIGKLYH
jgi:hypothetical protein